MFRSYIPSLEIKFKIFLKKLLTIKKEWYIKRHTDHEDRVIRHREYSEEKRGYADGI